MKKITKFYSGEKVYLRPVEEGDLELFYFGRNNPEVRETLFLFFPMTYEQVKNEVQSLIASKENLTFTIVENETNTPVGQTSFVRIDYVSRMATFFFALWDPEYWSKGYGSEATKLMVDYGFDILNLNRIQLHVAVENKNAIRAYEKCGFKIEGTLREAMYHHNRYCDFHLMAILRSEFYSSKQK
jgi:RimJ/RimL family protein N-acetyltransferase